MTAGGGVGGVIEVMARAMWDDREKQYDARLRVNWEARGFAGDVMASMLRAALSAALERGYRLAPVEPTQKMWGDGQNALKKAAVEHAWGDAWDLVDNLDERAIYRAMIAASPEVR